MTPRFGALSEQLGHFRRDGSASTVTVFSFVAVGLIVVAGGAVDYAAMSATQTQLQNAADASALAGAKEFRLGNAAVQTVEQVARTHALATLSKVAETPGSISVTPAVDTTAKTVKVTITSSLPTYVLKAFGPSMAEITVSATAKVVGGAPICVIGLDKDANKTVFLDKSAKLEAPGCSVYSNSTGSGGLEAKDDASIKAAFICTAGGKFGAKKASFTPDPQLDCPALPDPLAARPQPHAAGCIQTDLVLAGVATTLMPGTYCGGITIDKGAKVTFSPGVYVIKDGPLIVTGQGALTGANVGLFLTGKGAQIRFDGPSSVSLTAPKSGDMAGILIFEDRAAPLGQKHEITSNDTRMLLGTIYLSRGRLHVAAQSPVADKSAYTIVVANQFSLSEGPTMVLNTDYGATSIPVPAGVGPNSNRTALTN
ncbi:MAG: pilus assembly protein TadG-related protein [Siculibacillus sp.]|nr:pilus assembly protein TadG-related protein [Siculibacillus sp.]